MLVTSIFSFFPNVFKGFFYTGLLKILIVQLRVKNAFYSLVSNWFVFLTLFKHQNLVSSKLKAFADDNNEFYENSRKLSKRAENTEGKVEKMLVISNFYFFHSVFKRLVMQTRKNQGLLGKGLKDSTKCYIWRKYSIPAFSHFSINIFKR